mgnify:CR=1 FL=1
MSDLASAGLQGLAARHDARELPAAPTHRAVVHNPYCADEVDLQLVVHEGRVADAGWRGAACLVCGASAALMVERLVGRATTALAAERALLDRALSDQEVDVDGPYAALAPVRRHASRRACATLPWEAMAQALEVPFGQASGACHGDPPPSSAAVPRSPWEAVAAYRAEGCAVAVATLTDVVGSSPAPLGSRMVIADDGRFWGSVSGGCVESAVVQEALALLAGEGAGGDHVYQIANSQAGEVGLPCGGRVTVSVALAPSARELEAQAAAARAAAPTLVMVGGTHIAQKLGELAHTVGFRPVLVEPRTGWGGVDRFPHVEVVRGRPEDVLESCLSASSAVVMLTHDPALDDPAIRVALASPAFHVAALGSRKTQRRRLERLRAAGVPEQQLARLHGPAGLPIGAKGAGEIALSMLAEVVQARRQAERPRRVGAVVLAAGSSQRAGAGNKLLQPLEGQPLVAHAVDAVLAAGVAPVTVVLGHEADAVRAALGDRDVRFVRCDDHAEGMGRSIAAGVRACRADLLDGLFVVLGDMPWLRAADLRTLLEAHTPATQQLVLVPVAGEGDQRRPGNPVLWPARLFPELEGLRGDVGGRALLRAAPGAMLRVPIEHRGVLDDVDGML